MFNFGDKVRVIRPCEDAPLCKDEIYSVAIVVNDGETHRGKETGIVVCKVPGEKYKYSVQIYPYVWNFNRFEKVV